jgi:hypothetical protein
MIDYRVSDIYVHTKGSREGDRDKVIAKSSNYDRA